MENLGGSIFAWLFVCCLFGWFDGCHHVGDSSDVTLAFEDAQVIKPFSREKTDNIDDTDDTDDTDGTEDTDDTESTENTESTESTESTER